LLGAKNNRPFLAILKQPLAEKLVFLIRSSCTQVVTCCAVYAQPPAPPVLYVSPSGGDSHGLHMWEAAGFLSLQGTAVDVQHNFVLSDQANNHSFGSRPVV
jgi:hypothetical protein